MNQEKTGKLIACCRKEKALTQADLAEKLGITDRAVSKWETGKSLPDANIMLELCDLLGISVTELLVGERIIMEDYKKVTEAELLEMAEREKRNGRKLLFTGIAITVMCFLTAAVMLCAAALAVADTLWRWILIITAITVLFGGVLTVLTIEYKTGYYKCPNCGRTHVPSVSRYLGACNLGLSKILKCPYCKQRGLHKKVFKSSK